MAHLTLTAIVYDRAALDALRVSVYLNKAQACAAAWTPATLVLVVVDHFVRPLTFSKLRKPPSPSIPIRTVSRLDISNCGRSGKGTPA